MKVKFIALFFMVCFTSCFSENKDIFSIKDTKKNIEFSLNDSRAKIEKERGTQDGKKKKQKYYLCNRKIYNRRFSTDCFSDYFNEQARKTKVGLNDYAEYSAVKATVTELKQQNSYFINSLYKCDGEEDK